MSNPYDKSCDLIVRPPIKVIIDGQDMGTANFLEVQTSSDDETCQRHVTAVHIRLNTPLKQQLEELIEHA